MRHPAEGVLRRLLDEPDAVAQVDRQHVAGCDQCIAELSGVREDAALVDAYLGSGTAGGADVAAAWRRLATSEPARGPERAVSSPPVGGRLPGVLRRPAAAVLAVAVVLGGAGTAAAGGWLPIFRTEQVSPVSFSTADLLALPDLSAYGDLALTTDPAVHEVPDAAAAEAQSGLDVPEVTDLPAGISARPVYSVGGKAVATFTFSAERAAQAASAAGMPAPPVPPDLDGSQVRLEAGPGVAQVWESGTGAPALVVGRALPPTASSTGVSFETLRDYLLSLPGLPDQIARQLRTFTADDSTLPLPVPADQASTTPAQVDGAPATVLTTRDRTLAAVVWVDDGVLTVVAGSLDRDEVLAVARGLE